ncbi:MAG: thiamine pyrophosphate-binding protein, partial [Prevotella sp.]|nr:thiamine pyrophosphate-binding protein [Prevotella sp.]
MYCDKENVNILTALLVKHGVKHVVVCPGSRNAPLAHNFNECPDLTCHSMTDERSAAFFALGIRQQTNTPVAVCVTSGSALLNTLPGTAEAAYQQQGIIIISADRPAAWIGQNDGQTLPQQNALGCFVEKSVSIPEPHNSEERWMCNRLI